jgi:hypothetical protein
MKSVILIIIIPVGAYIRGKIYEFMKNYYYNGSWKDRKKR